ncbi:MAG: sigma-70 family RNA polymerase sigma factor [Erysipelotrichales bacterium]|nr:sigma-70 family RNA polymerase sigma factor [Erysipelotrichales bacterium]
MYKLLMKFIGIFKRPKRVLYIQSSDMLPPPLTDEEEKFYFNLVSEGSMEARNKIIEHNLRLVVYIAKKFESIKVGLEDLISIGSMGLIKSVQTFKLDKNIKFATYASRCIENEILMFLRKISKTVSEVSLNETINVDSDGNELFLTDLMGTEKDEAYEPILQKEKELIMLSALGKLKKREKEIIGLRFGLNNQEALTQKEVADYLGISQSYISRLEKRIFNKLKDELELKLYS